MELWNSGSGQRIICRENACSQQCLRVGIEHAGRNCVARKRTALDDACRGGSARTIPKQDRRRLCGRTRDVDCGGTEVATVLSRRRNNLVGRTSIHQAAPFHVVEEKCWVILPQRHLAAEIETVSIESQLLHLLRSRVEVVARIKRVVAVELPRGSMELFGSRLDHRGDGRRSSQ